MDLLVVGLAEQWKPHLQIASHRRLPQYGRRPSLITIKICFSLALSQNASRHKLLSHLLTIAIQECWTALHRFLYVFFTSPFSFRLLFVFFVSSSSFVIFSSSHSPRSLWTSLAQTSRPNKSQFAFYSHLEQTQGLLNCSRNCSWNCFQGLRFS